jgi:hypothetical protein
VQEHLLVVLQPLVKVMLVEQLLFMEELQTTELQAVVELVQWVEMEMGQVQLAQMVALVLLLQ